MEACGGQSGVARRKLLAAAVAVYAGPAGIAYSPAAALIGVHRRLRSPGTVALTFDDGPQPGATEHFLELLARLEVRATFFLVGEQVQRFPALARQIHLAGHEIGNHGYRHRNHFFRSPWEILTDCRRGAAVISDVIGQRPQLFRPPQGVVTAATRLAAYREGSALVLWTGWGRDWRPEATVASIRNDALRRVGEGSILLLHDADYYRARSWHATFQAVPQITDELRRRGLMPGAIGGPDRLGW